MTDLVPVSPGDIADWVRRGCLVPNVGNRTPSAPRRVRFGACRSAEAAVLHETPTGYMLLDTAPMPIVLHRDWCEQV